MHPRRKLLRAAIVLFAGALTLLLCQGLPPLPAAAGQPAVRSAGGQETAGAAHAHPAGARDCADSGCLTAFPLLRADGAPPPPAAWTPVAPPAGPAALRASRPAVLLSRVAAPARPAPPACDRCAPLHRQSVLIRI